MLLDISSTDETIEKQAGIISRLRQQLAETLQDNTALYDFSPTPYLIINQNGVIQSANFQAAILIGRDRKSIVNTIFLNFIAFNSKTRIESTIKNLLQKLTKQSCEVELLQKGGSRIQLKVNCILLKNNLIQLCLIDITCTQELLMQVFELNKSLNLVNNLFQNATDAIASLDSDLTINLLNHAFSDLFSTIFSIKIQTGTNISTVLSDFPEIKLNIITACKNAILGKHVSIILENPKENERYYCYELDINYFYNQYTHKNGLILRIKSLTEYKLEEQKQHRKQADIATACKTSTMSEMASVFAHEINQPLTAIIAYSRSCLYMMNDTSDYKNTCSKLLLPLEQMAEQAEHAGKIIHNMKNIMHDGNFYLEKTDINVLIKETISILKYELQHFKYKISLKLQENLPQTTTNKIHIMQIVLNLARNSIEALESVSEVKPELLIETRELDEHIQVHVIDNGPGIPVEFQSSILNTYFTTKPQGTGIGLGVCRSLIEAHGGTLTINQQANTGAWFTFTLPVI